MASLNPAMHWAGEALHEACTGAREETTDEQKIRQYRVDQIVKGSCLGVAGIWARKESGK